MTKQKNHVNITIRSMNGKFSTSGIELVGNDALGPKLLPLEIVSVESDHPIFDCDGSKHIEITRESPTRPLFFNDSEELSSYLAGNKKHKARIVNAMAQIGTSMERSAKIRAENKARRDEMSGQGLDTGYDNSEPDVGSSPSQGNAFVRGEQEAVIEKPESTGKRGARTRKNG